MDSNSHPGKIPISQDTVMKIVMCMKNQMQVFGGDEDSKEALSGLIEEIQESDLSGSVFSDIETIEVNRQQSEDVLSNLNLYSDIVMTTEVCVSEKDVRTYSVLPELTVVGPIKNAQVSVIRSSVAIEGGEEKTWKFIYRVSGDIDHDAIEDLAFQGLKLGKEKLFDLIVLSPYWEADEMNQSSVQTTIT